MISDKLLSELLGECCKEFRRIENGRLMYFCSLAWAEDSVELYEFAHRAKVWAFEQGYTLITGLKMEDAWTADCYKDYDSTRIISKTEPEAIFAACEWILKQKDRDGKKE